MTDRAFNQSAPAPSATPVLGAAGRDLRFGWLLFALAWRNLWRNRRRTWLTIGGIAFAVWFLIFARSMQTGTFDIMIDNGARLLPGHLQIQHPNYAEDSTVANSFHTAEAAETLADLSVAQGLLHVSARAQGFALVSVGERSFGAQVIGVEPEIEVQWSGLAAMTRTGRYLAAPGEAVMGVVLARNLGLSVGDEFVLLGTASEGGIAALSSRLVGVFNTGNHALNRAVLQVHLDDFRDAWAMHPAEAHAMVGVANSVTGSEHIAAQLSAALPELAVLNWQDLMPEAQQTRDMKAVSTELLFYVIAIIVGFSVVTTFMMMVFERTQEMGVMIAIGMRPGFIRLQLQIEAMYVAVVGVLSGGTIAALLSLALRGNGIPVPGDMAEIYAQYNIPGRIVPEFDTNAAWSASLLMLIGVQVAAFIPALRIGRLSPVEAIRNES
ncbi:MAG: FtsX-like permease family protein [Pseudomonadota bacterium]